MENLKAGLFGCMWCKDLKKEKTAFGKIRTCPFDKCPYFDEEKMHNKGIHSYGEWIDKGCPDCSPEEN